MKPKFVSVFRDGEVLIAVDENGHVWELLNNTWMQKHPKIYFEPIVEEKPPYKPINLKSSDDIPF